MAAQKDAFTPVRVPFNHNEYDISSITSLDDRVYIGTTDGRIVLFNWGLDENDRQRLASGQSQPTFVPECEVIVSARQRVPVLRLELWADQGMLFSLSGGEVRTWNTKDLTPKPHIGCPEKVKMIVCDSLPKSNKIAINVEKKLYIYTYTGQTFNLLKTIDLPDIIVRLSYLSNLIAVSFKTNRKYGLVDISKGIVNELTTTPGRPECDPCIAPAGIGDTGEEFLICQEHKGLTIEKSGSQTRQKMNFSSVPIQMTVMRPYIIAQNGVEVANMFSREKPKLLQHVPSGLNRLNQGTKWIFGYHDQLLVCLVPLPWHDQVRQLIFLEKPTDAMKLIQVFMTSSVSKSEGFKGNVKSLQGEAGHKFFEQADFENAFKYYKLSDVQPREVVAHFPEFNVASWNLQNKSVHQSIQEYVIAQNAVPPTPGQVKVVLDANAIYTNLLNLMRDWLEFSLAKYSKSPETKADIDVTLIKLYAELAPEKVIPYLKDPKTLIPPGSADEYFKRTQKWGPLALIYISDGKDKDALDLFRKMAQNQLPAAEGIDPIALAAELLAKSCDLALIREYSTFIVKVNPKAFRSIFINEVRPFNTINHDHVLAFVKNFGALEREYLDFIVNVCRSEEPKYHVLLANLLLQALLQMVAKAQPGEVQQVEAAIRGAQVELSQQANGMLRTRQNLLRLLNNSKHYDPKNVLAQIESVPLNEEKVVLYQRLEMHEKALTIIVHELNDPQRAEEYCLKLGGAEVAEKGNLFKDHTGPQNFNLYTLLTVFLADPNTKNSIPNIINLINKYPEGFDPVAVLKILPPTIPLNKITRFLSFALKDTTHRMHHAQVVKSLETAQHLKLQTEKMKLEEQKVYITNTSTCNITNQAIGDKAFIRYPNGVIVAMPPDGNFDKHVCPITGRDFRRHPYAAVLEEKMNK